MTVMKKTAITLACATALAALTSAPSFAGVITPTDKLAVSTGSPIDSVYYGGCPYRRHHYHWRGCHAAWRSPCSSWAWSYPYATTAWGWGGPGWGGWGGWGGGGLLGAGLFGIL